MGRTYIPILKCKKGEQTALINLSEEIKDSIIPLIEIPNSSAIFKKSAEEIISSFWGGRKYFFYFMPDWYDNDVDTYPAIVNEQIIPLCTNTQGIPVIDLSLLDYISDWSLFSASGVAIRLRNNEFGSIEDVLNPLFSSGTLTRNKTDLILDLQYVAADDLFAKSSMLKAAFSDLDNASDFRSIIIASVSFPRQLPSMETKKIYRFNRVENEVFLLSLKLAERFKFEYAYSDYGPSDIEDVPFVVGMSPNFKIKYTAFDDYLYIKGAPLKKGGLDIGSVQELARILVECDDFSGPDYSWGDQKIYQLAEKKLNNSGNLTTWVSYAMNHHITFIYNQI